MGSRWIFLAIPSVRLETGVGGACGCDATEGAPQDRGRYEEDDPMAGLQSWRVYLASNMIAQNPSATSNNEAPICSGPILGA